MSSSDEIPHVCAACGTAGEGLKKCVACKTVRYCNRECQIAHRPAHKRACKQKAAELFEEALFRPPPPREECPICFLPLPLSDRRSMYRSCCGKTVCLGCCYAESMGRHLEGKSHAAPCPFCRSTNSSLPTSEIIGKLKQRVEANDAEACYQLGTHYFSGSLGLPQDENEAMNLWNEGIERGSVRCQYTVGITYLFGGDGIERNLDKAKYHFERAAMAGHADARFRLGALDMGQMGNGPRALKHFTIAAKAGHNDSLKAIRECYSRGLVTKEEFAVALRTHKDAQDQMKSEQRDKATAMIESRAAQDVMQRHGLL
ncbi:hypothetical protein ACHAXT_010474 [Thalassiosira profunda]